MASNILPLQLPEWKQPPLVSFANLGAGIARRFDQEREDAQLKREGEAFGGLVDVAQGTTPPAPQELPRGLRNNNPGNIEDGPLAKSLPGYRGPEPGEGRFATFDTPENGLNAMDALLVSYGRRGLKTVRDVVTRWAPKSAKDPNNDPEKYATYVGQGNPDQVIDFSNPEQRKQIVQAMARFENGVGMNGQVQGVRPGGGLPPELAKRIRALFAVGTPEARKAATALVNRFLPGGAEDEAFTLAEGATRFDRAGNVIARGQPKRERRDRETTEEAIASREKALKDRGIDTNDPDMRQYILTGKLPGDDKPTKGSEDEVAGREAVAKKRGLNPDDPNIRAWILTGRLPREDVALTAGDREAIRDADGMVLSNENAIANLKKAKELSPKAKYGIGAGPRGYLGSLVEGDEGGPGTDTEKLSLLVTGNGLEQLKAIFGSAPTEGERKILLEIQGSVNKTDAVRQDIYDRAIALAEKRLKLNRERAEQLRGGTFYKPKTGDKPGGPAANAEAMRANAEEAVKSGRWTLEQANAKLKEMNLPPLAAQ